MNQSVVHHLQLVVKISLSEENLRIGVSVSRVNKQ